MLHCYFIFITFTFTLNRNGITSLLPARRIDSIAAHAIMRACLRAVYGLLDVFYHPARADFHVDAEKQLFHYRAAGPFPALRIVVVVPWSFTRRSYVRTFLPSCSITLPYLFPPFLDRGLFAPHSAERR